MSLFSHLPLAEISRACEAEVDTLWRSGGGDDCFLIDNVDVRRSINGGRERDEELDLEEALEVLRLKTPMMRGVKGEYDWDG